MREQMSAEPTTKRGRDAGPEDMRRLLVRFDSDPERAWRAYDGLRRKLVMFFEYERALDAEELAAEVLERIAKKPDGVEIENIAEFAFGVARNLRREALRKAAVISRLPESGGDEEIAGRSVRRDDIADRIDERRKLGCFVECMKRLAPEDRRLLLSYYPAEGDRLEECRLRLAASLGLNLGALRTRVARLREKLEQCFGKCRSRAAGGM